MQTGDLDYILVEMIEPWSIVYNDFLHIRVYYIMTKIDNETRIKKELE